MEDESFFRNTSFKKGLYRGSLSLRAKKGVVTNLEEVLIESEQNLMML